MKKGQVETVREGERERERERERVRERERELRRLETKLNKKPCSSVFLSLKL